MGGFCPPILLKGAMKVNIIGLGSSWKKAPMEGETWSMNAIVLKRPVKLIFSMHPIDEWLQTATYGEEVLEKMQELDIPVITVEKDERLPNATLFPIDEMPSKYFTNSIAYMIAYAIYEGATTIHLYGVPLVLKDEYREQRACIEFWLGMAMGKGIDVTIYGGTSLFTNGVHAGLYGYEWNQLYQKIP